MPPPHDLQAESLRHGSVRYVLEVAPSMLRESDVISDILIERIRSQEDSEEAVNAILRLMSLHLQSNAHITEQLVELLFTSDYRLCIINHLPKLTYQSHECTAMVLDAYRDLLESDSTLVVPILGSLADMPLTPDQQNAVVTMTQTLMLSIDEVDIPVVVRGMLAMITSSNGDTLIGSIREQCLDLNTHTLLLVVEVMGPFLRQGSPSLKYILRAMRNADKLTPIDGIWLVLLHAQDPITAWHALTRLGRKCTQTWLESTADLAIPASLVHPFIQFCLLVVHSGFAKPTLASLRPYLVVSGVRTVAYVMAHTPPGSSVQHEALATLLTLTTQSHKFTSSTKQQELRWHVPRAAAICIADAVACLPPASGHVILDTIYILSAANDVAFLHVVDTLCFTLVQLVARDPSALYALVLLTIQKHILGHHTTFQITAMLLASHLSYANQLEPLDARAITAWMHRLFHTAPLQMVSFICAYLSVQQDNREADEAIGPLHKRSSGLALLVPALFRRGIVSGTPLTKMSTFSAQSFRVDVTRFVATHVSDSGDVKVEALHALLDMVHCVVVHAMREAETDADKLMSLEKFLPPDVSIDSRDGGARPTSPEDDVGTRQCLLMVAIGVCNGLHPHVTLSPHADDRNTPLFTKLQTQFLVAYALATALDMTSTLVVLSHQAVLDLTHVVPYPAIHVLHLMLQHRPAHTAMASPHSTHKPSVHNDNDDHHHWQLYGTYTNLHDHVDMYLPHLPHWMALVLTYGHHEHQPTHAETLVQLYTILRQLLLDFPEHTDAILAALSSRIDASARSTVFEWLHEQATEQLQDAQAIVVVLDLQVAVAGPSTALRHETARLAHSVAKHVFPDAALDLATWKPHISRPIAATTALHPTPVSLDLPPSTNSLASSTYYIHHAVVTAYALHPTPTVFLKEILDALCDMIETPDRCHPTYRSLTRHTFRLLLTTHWQCLLHHVPSHVLIRIGEHGDDASVHEKNPFAHVVMGFSLVADSFAAVPKAIQANVDVALAPKTIGLMLKACQVVCEQMVKGVDRCLKWRQTTALDNPNGDVRHMSPVLLQMDLALAEMEKYVVTVQHLALHQWKAAAKPDKSKLQKLVDHPSKKSTTPALPAGQVKFIPQVLRWIQRTQLSLAKTQQQYSIPVGSDLDLADMVVWPRGGYDWESGRDRGAMSDRWRHMTTYEYDEEEKEEVEEHDGQDDNGQDDDANDYGDLDGFFASVTRKTTVQALQTPQKEKRTSDLHDNDAFGFPSIVVDFKATKRRTTKPSVDP
ncbi:hypothetical protein, variant 1 [Aphanomyces invadans]|uniref:Uncharacterized protein n=1 Tax=Aphanomyces invadans TaxID=157072 RepID=A0A024UIZ4_9STRA|nr:hypothetical protein, variant 1 [Aphanomyces invadans]ETW06170.1 hypothetical protein, variant 1 [Aphanomyces invadans]|eukprot:XP_008865947.1 hypothetical protein, variant 1 [Aphanomyces invadans]